LEIEEGVKALIFVGILRKVNGISVVIFAFGRGSFKFVTAYGDIQTYASRILKEA
jgi:hypothetical protein